MIAVVALAAAGCGGGAKSAEPSPGATRAASPTGNASPAAGSGIAGSVVLAGAFGRVPFAGARVLVRESAGSALRQTTAGPDGSFRVDAAAGDYTVAAVYQGTPSPPLPVKVAAGRVSQVALQVEPAVLQAALTNRRAAPTSLLAGSIEGVGHAGGEASPGVQLTVRAVKPGESIASRAAGGHPIPVQAAPDGRFFLALPPGRYMLAGASGSGGRPLTVTLSADAVTRVTLPLTELGGERAGVGARAQAGYLDGYVAIVGRNGAKPWVGAPVKVWPYKGGAREVAVTGSDGRFYLALAPGKYVVRSGFFGSRNGTRTIRVRPDAVATLTISALITQVGGEFSDATARLPHQGSGGN